LRSHEALVARSEASDVRAAWCERCIVDVRGELMSSTSLASAAPAHVSLRKALLVCGILASLVYVVANVAGALAWEGYRSAHQAVSELSALGAPSRPVMVPLLVLYDVLFVAFAIGVWETARSPRALRIAAGSVVALAVVNAAAIFTPMDLHGDVTVLTNTLHVGMTILTSILTVAAMAFAASAFGKGFRAYTIASIVVLLVFGALTGLQAPRIDAGLPTPWLGVMERINIGAYLLWMAMLAVMLLRARRRE